MFKYSPRKELEVWRISLEREKEIQRQKEEEVDKTLHVPLDFTNEEFKNCVTEIWNEKKEIAFSIIKSHISMAYFLTQLSGYIKVSKTHKEVASPRM